jgi:hypothetical protein
MAAFLAAAVLFLVCTWRAIFRWRELRVLGLIAPLVVLGSIPLGVAIGHSVRDWQFSRDLPRYKAAAKWASSRAVPGDTTVLEAPAEYADLAYIIHVRSDKECELFVDFFWGGGFPVKHTIRRFASLPSFVERKQCTKDWARGRKLQENWYELSD